MKTPIAGYTGHISGKNERVGKSAYHGVESISAKYKDNENFQDDLYFRSISPTRTSSSISRCTTAETVSLEDTYNSRTSSPTRPSTREKSMTSDEVRLQQDRARKIQGIVGYSGQYQGKIHGKLGQPEVHKDSISSPVKQVKVDKEIMPTYKGDVPRIGNNCSAVAPASVDYTRLYPIAGYTGAYRGKVNGNLGRSNRHISELSAWDGDVTESILGDGIKRIKLVENARAEI